MISIFTLETAIIGGKKIMLGLFSGSGPLPLPPSLGAAPRTSFQASYSGSVKKVRVSSPLVTWRMLPLVFLFFNW
jgi:hypothetical protein